MPRQRAAAPMKSTVLRTLTIGLGSMIVLAGCETIDDIVESSPPVGPSTFCSIYQPIESGHPPGDLRDLWWVSYAIAAGEENDKRTRGNNEAFIQLCLSGSQPTE